jgi:hypothetical protein
LVHVSETRVNPPPWGTQLKTTVPGPVWLALVPGPDGLAVAVRADVVVVAAFVVAGLVVAPGAVVIWLCAVANGVPGLSVVVAAGTLAEIVAPIDGVSPAAGSVHPTRARAIPTRRVIRTISSPLSDEDG